MYIHDDYDDQWLQLIKMDLASDLFRLEHLSQPNMLVIVVMSVGDIGQAGINVSHYRGSARRGEGVAVCGHRWRQWPQNTFCIVVSSQHHQHQIFSISAQTPHTKRELYLPFQPFTDTCEHPPRHRIHSSWSLTLLPDKLILYVNWNCKYDLIFLAPDIFDLFEYWIWRNGHATNSVHPSK